MTDKTPPYLTLLARYYRVWRQSVNSRKQPWFREAEPRIVGKRRRLGIVRMDLYFDRVTWPVYQQRIAFIANAFGLPVDQMALQNLKKLLTHRKMVFSPTKLRSAFLIRKANTLNELAAAIAMSYPSVCPDPGVYTPLPGFSNQLDSQFKP